MGILADYVQTHLSVQRIIKGTIPGTWVSSQPRLMQDQMFIGQGSKLQSVNPLI